MPRFMILICAAAAWVVLSTATLPRVAQAQEAPSAAIEGVISSQIDAFRTDDFETAFTFASPQIQGLFRTPQNFGQMVQQGYPMVWRPSELQYGDLRDEGGALWQRVIIRDRQGTLHMLDYRMVMLDGVWKIAGVQIVEAPDVAA